MELMDNHLGDPGRAHMCLTWESKLCLDKKGVQNGFYILVHRLLAPNVAELRLYTFYRLKTQKSFLDPKKLSDKKDKPCTS